MTLDDGTLLSELPKDDPALTALLRKAVEQFKAMTDTQRKEVTDRQRESWARSGNPDSLTGD